LKKLALPAQFKKSIFWVATKSIIYCTPPGKDTFNQCDGNLLHPHAGQNRGMFSEEISSGLVLDSDWDCPYNFLPFESLYEFIAIRDFFENGISLQESVFYQRFYKYMSSGKKARGYSDYNLLMRERELQLTILIESISLNGVVPVGGMDATHAHTDDVSVNVTRNGDLLFNNRGHHRLSIAKLLNVEFIPVNIVCWHSSFVSTIYSSGVCKLSPSKLSSRFFIP